MIARGRQLTASAGWLALVLPLAVVLMSVALSPDSNWTVRAALAGFCVLAIWRPAEALLVTIALVGFGNILSHLAGAPLLRSTEVLVVASIAGCLVRVLRPDTSLAGALTRAMSVPIVLLAVAGVASTMVWLRVDQVQTGYLLPYVDALLHFVTHDYFFQRGEFLTIGSGAVLLEGLALYVAAAALCRGRKSRPRALVGDLGQRPSQPRQPGDPRRRAHLACACQRQRRGRRAHARRG